jgi:hypothetical protein
MRIFSFILSILLFISGCANISYVQKKNGQYQVRPLSKCEKTGNLSIRHKFPTYNEREISDKSKIFLVAASSNSANFLQEIVEQRRIFLSMGYKKDEIVCYYVIPTEKEFKHDKDQFESLLYEVESFYLASPRNLFKHLKKAGHTDVPYLYVYITSHGGQPLGESMHKYVSTRYLSSKEANKQIDLLSGVSEINDEGSHGPASAEVLAVGLL